jgi:glycosyltransferase involved in cell wall biosynthesis
VVASNAGGLPESVLDRETGLIVPAGNAEALAGALVELLRDSERAREMGRAGRERALRLYDRPRVVERIVDLYHQVLERGQA